MMNLIKCAPEVRAKCPYKVPCCKDDEANYFEGSDCDKFAQKVLAAPMTNGDRIRAMTDEELAKLIDSCYGMYSCDFCPNGKNVLDRELCKGELCHRKTGADVILDWLKQPVEVEHDQS